MSERDHRVEIRYLPQIFIKQISIADPATLPPAIPGWYNEDLIVDPSDHKKRNLVPLEVLQYFKENPDKEQLIHSDGYIYHLPYMQTRDYRPPEQGYFGDPSEDQYHREFNYSPIVQQALCKGSELDNYLMSISKQKGLLISPNSFLPEWQEIGSDVFIIPNVNVRNLYLVLHQENPEIRSIDLLIAGDGPEMFHEPTMIQLWKAATIEYNLGN